MSRKLSSIIAALSVTACAGDETLSGYGLRGESYQLLSIDGTTYNGVTHIVLNRREISLVAPCDTWTADLAAPYPWFELHDLRPVQTIATPPVCAERAAENAVIDAITSMTIAEVSGRVMILSDTSGRSMVFQAAE